MTQDFLNMYEPTISPQEELSLLYRLQKLSYKYNSSLDNKKYLTARILELERIIAHTPRSCSNCSCGDGGCR